MDFVSGLRAALQDVLVPELKAIQVRLEHVEQGLERLDQRLEGNEVENKRAFEALLQRMDAHQARSDQRFEALTREMNQRFEANAQEHSAMLQTMALMNGKLDVLITLVADLKEVSYLKARLEVVEREVADLRARR